MSVAAFTRLTQGIDDRGYPIIAARPQSNCIDAMDFSGAAVKSDTVPVDASSRKPNFVVFGVSQNVDIFVKIGGTAAVPGADVTDGSASEANPLVMQLAGASSVGVAVSAACIVTLSYYS